MVNQACTYHSRSLSPSSLDQFILAVFISSRSCLRVQAMVRFAVLLTLFGPKKHIGGHRYFSIGMADRTMDSLAGVARVCIMELSEQKTKSKGHRHGSDKYSFTC